MRKATISIASKTGAVAILATLFSLLAIARTPHVPSRLKTMRFDHGVPIVVRSASSFLVLEFELNPRERVSTRGEDTFQVLAPYRFRVIDLNASIEHQKTGSDTLTEHYRFRDRTRPDGSRSRQLTDIGSSEEILFSPFRIQWSNGGSGQRSWLYFVRDSNIEFVQAFPDRVFEQIDSTFLHSIRNHQNIFLAQDEERTVHAYGNPFPHQNPTPNSPRINDLQAGKGSIRLSLDNLTSGNRYLIEQSETLHRGGWTVAKSFIATKSHSNQTLPIALTGSNLFFRLKSPSPPNQSEEESLKTRSH